MQNRENMVKIQLDDLLDCHDDRKEEVNVPEGITSLKENCLFNRRIKRLVLPTTMKSASFHAINSCIIGELKLQSSDTFKYAPVFSDTNIRNLVLAGENKKYDLNLEGASVQFLVVEDGASAIKVNGGNIKNAILPSTILSVDNDTFTDNAGETFNLTVSDRTWLNTDSLRDVTTLRIYFDINKGIMALRRVLFILSSLNCSKLQQVVLINSGMNIFELIKLKREYKNIKFSLETVKTSNLVETTVPTTEERLAYRR